jgi:Holliday junction DNA helicase RuvA
MISRIEGILEAVREGRVLLRCEHVAYDILIPGADQQRLPTMIGERIALHTLHYYESQGQGASFIPRLIGFSTPEDRAFFELFTTVKGLGNRKALRALQLPFHRVAEAIAAKDADTLKSLPEIGKRSAETIIAELSGKVDRFVRSEPGASPGAPGAGGAAARSAGQAALAGDAVAVLTTLGEPKLTAMQLVDRALGADPTIDTTEDLIAAVYRLKALP